ncbi:G patch domain-containing protein 8 isoform X2 [Dunckerocampus dactyliophorus]|uniref:G patch domain-containing protein 8 isoform X2 n=1 Tax=Dunckerocampus dactyliophorus TaxID=161453 RepID=UPI002405D5C0|nr:G patch domain-containing protein 8 isoform X2 [Dunckerocampus dactyliophorus]
MLFLFYVTRDPRGGKAPLIIGIFLVCLLSPVCQDNIGHRLLQKHGWKLGQGLGKTMQGRTDPVPIILKYDVMGMGRMEMEMDYAEDATEKRRVLEVEKEETEELRQKYKDQMEKEKAIAKALEDLRANFYCELCDKQYTKHQEFDNHINSYGHAHKQRLKELKQREFARNVSSRSRKGGKKQEKMLRRLHELADQRKQQDRTPGSGPMFKTTTVVVDGQKAEDSDSIALESTAALPEIPVEVSVPDKRYQPSPKPARTFSFPLGRNKCSSPTASASSKVSVSFSFAKKAPVKLETAAAVFTDHGEEAVEGEEEEGQEVEKAAAQNEASVSDGDSPKGGSRGSEGAEPTSAAVTEEEAPQLPPPPQNDGSSLASTLNKLKMMMMKKEEGYMGQEPQYYHYMPPAHCRVKPHFQFLLFMKATDQGQSKEDGEEDEVQEEKIEDGSQQTESNVQECNDEEDSGTTTSIPDPSQQTPPSPKVKDGDNAPRTVETTPDVPASPAEKGETPQDLSDSNSGPKIPTGPFFPVLSKDESTTLQWPSELLEFTKAQPSLSYSCNPLYFDFKLSRNKGPRAGKVARSPKTCEQPDKEQQHEQEKGATVAKVEPAAKAELSCNNDEAAAKGEGGPSEGDDQKAATSGGGAKKKKKKKKHKKSTKHLKRKAKDKLAAEDGEGETEPTQEMPKKKKKHKKKKSKNKGVDQKEAVGDDKEKTKAKSEDISDASSVQASSGVLGEVGKRKRSVKDQPSKSEAEEGNKGKCQDKVASTEEHGGRKRLKTESAASQTISCSTSAQKSPGPARPPSSESEEEGGSTTQRSRHHRSSPREERRHHSEESRRSCSRSSRRGSSCRRHHRGKTSQSRSYSSSSERSSAGSSAYSHRSRSYSDSYSDYSTEGHRRRRSKRSSDSEYERRGSRGRRRSRRRQYSSSSSDDSRSRSRSYSRRKRHRRHHRSTSRSSSSWSRSTSARSWRRSYSRSRSSASRSSSSTKVSPHRRGNRSRGGSETSRRDFNRSRIYRSQSPRSNSRSLNRSVTSSLAQRLGGSRDAGEHKNSLTARQLLEKIQAKKNSDDPVTGPKSGLKIKDPPQGYFGPKLPPAIGNKSILPLFGKLQAGKKTPIIPLTRPDEGEKSGPGKSCDVDGEIILVEPIREFPPPPPPPAPPVQKVEEAPQSTAPQEEMTTEGQVVQEPHLLFEQESSMMMPQYQVESAQDPSQNPMMESLMPDQQPPMHGYPVYAPQGLEEEGMEAEEDGLAPLESQPITFTPEEMEKYSKLQQAAQQHIQQQLLAKQVKTFPSAAVAAVAAAANLTPAPPPPALQQIHIQQPAVSVASGTSIATVQHALLQHHAATAAAMGIHPAHHPHPAHAQLAQVHHIPQHHLTPISLSPLGHTLGHSLGHSLGHAGLIPAHPTAFLSGQPIHIIPASALHHTPLALHHVPHAALYPTLFTPRPSQAAAAAAALQLHPLLHPIFSGQDLQHPPNHGS